MSISFCDECEHIIEGDTYMAFDEDGDYVEHCNYCKVPCSGLPEERSE
jgi:hypothetical protein